MRYGLIALLFAALPARGDDWPQWMGPNRDGVWAETSLLAKLPEAGPKVLWRAPVQLGYAGPAVAGGKVYVTDYVVKSGDTEAAPTKKNDVDGTERVLCMDSKSGKVLWTHEYPCKYKISYPGGPRCTPTVDGDRVYTLGAEGNLCCLDANTGKVRWARELKKDYKCEAPLWGFCGHPLVDGDRLHCLVGGDGSIAVCFDKNTGKEIWRALSAKEPGYCPPTMISAGGTKQLIYWHSDAVCSLDPATGKQHWSIPCAPKYAMSIMAPRQSGEYLFAGGIGEEGVLIKLASDRPAAELAWKGKKDNAMYPANSTPVVVGDIMYGVDCMPGALRAVRLPSGDRLWENFAAVTGKKAPHGTSFLVRNGDRFILFTETGHLLFAKLTPQGYEEVSRWKMLE
ncbi:MAG: PQQ-like beta-propeller repeat protein, partial [Gemmataceae bacterium]|nr:PQQ-like beta-propeller repeat protein [Gemmataceae bacterium]